MASGAASAQVYDRGGYDPATDDRYRAARAIRVEEARAIELDEARVVRVDPVFDDGSWYDDTRMGDAGHGGPVPGRYVDYGNPVGRYGNDGPADGGYPGDRYRDGGAPGDGYAGGGYAAPSHCVTRRTDGYAEAGGHRQGDWPRGGDRVPGTAAGSQNARTMATVIGGVLGAVVGSQVGGGSGRFATSAIGTMVGGIAGREVYEAGQRRRVQQDGLVTVCDPVSVDQGRPDAGLRGAVSAYDVIYEYAGREYTTRTRDHPGETIRVRVAVIPDE